MFSQLSIFAAGRADEETIWELHTLTSECTEYILVYTHNRICTTAGYVPGYNRHKICICVYPQQTIYISCCGYIYIYIYCCGYLCIPTTGSVPLQDMCQGITSIRYVLVYTHNRIRTRVTYTLHKICTVEPDYNGHLGTKSSWMLYRGGLFTEWRSKSKSS